MLYRHEKRHEVDDDGYLELVSETAVDTDRNSFQLVSRPPGWSTIFLTVSLLISLTLNSWWILLERISKVSNKEAISCSAPETQRSIYSGLTFDVPTRYSLHTDYSSSNQTLADYTWDNLNLDGMVIAPTLDWAREMGLPDSWDFPWDSNRKIYFVKVYHQLHCLKRIRTAFHELWSGQESTIIPAHIEHCLDTLRQDLMCKADDTPMPSLLAVNGAGDGQTLHCKNFDKLMAWTKHPDRDACYHRLNHDGPVRHAIERYAFCPPDSVHYAAMSRYFEEHGHYKDPV
ncbi:hypothetical protein BO71DRAFT_423152 [Aspergillus ellipticus CBS 707.79]|uniref:Tat pathway signal sequence n=1 Tax=Aspergillus ellipticus CBS 707.79 TaxID=1448320 RepID=A0A319CX13_9EURO|nr:hypothetical protein BO71DRAFT_423152 [Aspergillus ellipticus CBS 707.79]